MAYICELNPGHRVYLDNQGAQTIITTIIQQPGQQQQATSSIMTGVWTAPPVAYQQASGNLFKLFTDQGEFCIYVQGTSISTTTAGPTTIAQQLSLQQTTTVPTVPSMEPMPPMGNMQMNMNSMEMRMGNMQMQMGSIDPPAASQQFCTQCGTKVAAEDKFCGNCGHRLG